MIRRNQQLINNHAAQPLNLRQRGSRQGRQEEGCGAAGAGDPLARSGVGPPLTPPPPPLIQGGPHR